jgi:type I restriction enzyme S subunit
MTPEIKHRIGQIRRGEVPEGYVKKRKVVIPQQWGLPQIKDIASISSGSTPNRNNSEYWNGNIAWVTTGELSSGHVNHTSELITVKAVKETKMRIYPQGTLLMAMYGQGKTRGTVAILEIDAAVNQACAAITVKDGKSKFLFYQLKNSYQDIRKLSNTGNQENLNADIIKTYQVPWAPGEEQERISTILTTQDKVIELKEKRLAEKQRQKKYLMQQLLTGKKRLPGFYGAWSFPKAKELFQSVSDKDHNGDLAVLSSTQDRGIVPRDEVDIDIKYDACSLVNYKKVSKGNFVISLRSFQGGIEYSTYTGLVSPAYTVLSSRKEISDGYYKQFFKSTDYINRLNVAVYGIRDGKQISYEDFGRLRIPYPPIKEQNAIAEALSAADREIDLLRQDIEQEKQKKKALMQLLLTGIARVKT